MVAVLFLIGEGKETPELITQLLDLGTYPRKPNYEMASDAQLLLYEIGYDSIPAWHEHATSHRVTLGVNDLWGEQQRSLMLRSAMMHEMRGSLPVEAAAAAAMADGSSGGGNDEGGVASLAAAAARAGFYCATPPGGTDSRHSRNHKPFSERTTSESVEVKTKGKAK